jgi:hypothetical protein
METKISLYGGVGGGANELVYTAPNGVIVTSSAPPHNNHGIKNLFNGKLAHYHNQGNDRYWLTSSEGIQTLDFDLTALGNKLEKITQIKVWPRSNDTDSSHYRVLSSSNGQDWQEEVFWVANFHNDETPYLTLREYTVDITNKYLRFELMKNGKNGVTLCEIELWGILNLTDTHYYVNQQRGSDNFDGLTPQTAWKTITKAIDTITTNNMTGHIIVHVAPGHYRERLALQQSGLDLNHLFIIEGDPNCLVFPNANPGIVRITGCDANEIASESSPLINFNNKTFIEIRNVYLDGCNTIVQGNSIYGQNLRNCKINGQTGAVNVTCYDCEAIGATCYRGCTAYKCLGIGGNVFYQCPDVYNCTALGGNIGFGDWTSSTAYNSYNCVANGCINGFSGYFSKCQAINCTNPFHGAGITWDDLGGENYGAGTSGTNLYNIPKGPMSIVSVEVKNVLSAGLKNRGKFSAPELLIKKPNNFLLDVGHLEIPSYTLDWEDYKISAPSIKIEQQGQYVFKFPVEKGKPIVKSVWVKNVIEPTITPYRLFSKINSTYGFEAYSRYQDLGPAINAFNLSSGSTGTSGSGSQSGKEVRATLPKPVRANYVGVRPHSSVDRTWVLEARNTSGTWIKVASPNNYGPWSSDRTNLIPIPYGLYTGFRLRMDSAYYNPGGVKCLNAYYLESPEEMIPNSEEIVFKKPSMIVRGLGKEYYVESKTTAEEWEYMSIYFVPENSGVMELILQANNDQPGAFTLFSDPI